MSDTSPKRGFASEFWVGQMVVVICTIVGIYLAATVGFKKAVDLTLLQSDRDTYYLANSFAGEVETNIMQLNAFLAEYDALPFMPDGVTLSLNQFVFETMRFNGSTMEIESGVLNGISTFYLETKQTIDDLNAKQLAKPTGFKKLKELIAGIESDELPKLKSIADALRNKLKGQGITP